MAGGRHNRRYRCHDPPGGPARRYRGSTARSTDSRSSPFDDGTLAGWNTRRLIHADSAVVEYDVEGRPAVRIELRPGDYVSGGWRDELTDPFYARVGQELWYGFSTLIP